MRLNLAQALLCRSDLLLLDEPTNHLDLDVIWLEKWLKGYQGTLVLISHDRDFLDSVINRIIHIENGKLNEYTGGYSDFELQRAEHLAQQQSMYEKQQREMSHMQAYVDRFRYKASKARQAQSRLKAMERMEKILPAHADSEFSFEFREPSALPTPLIAMENLCAGYGDKVILEKIKLNLVPGSRIGLLGRNGAGKSTFIKMLSGSNPPLSGKLEVSAGVSIGYFAQHQLETLRLDDTPSITWCASPRTSPSRSCATTSAASAFTATRRSTRWPPSPAARRRGWCWPSSPGKSPTCCCWMNRPTTWIWRCATP
jgi:ATP-binding cassette subfamily F protein 3